MKHAKQARDPVCGMMVDIDAHAIQTHYEGTDYYFCSASCKEQFLANPQRYLAGVAASSGDSAHESLGGVPTPRFGSAGSGGAEYEPAPHGRKHN